MRMLAVAARADARLPRCLAGSHEALGGGCTDMSEAVRSFDGKAFLHLRNAAELMGGNASRVYLEVEGE